ncbi:unnamed protein product [Brassica rapa subsp. trilocularis]
MILGSLWFLRGNLVLWNSVLQVLIKYNMVSPSSARQTLMIASIFLSERLI